MEKRKWGDRRDARWVREVPGLQTVMCHLMPNRTDCEVYLHDVIDITETVRYLEKVNAGHPDYKTTVFHCMIFALAKMIRERPRMNYFVQGRRMYERNEISLSFVCRRRFTEKSEESLMYFITKPEDTLHTMSWKIAGEIQETRKSETATGGIDKLLDIFAAIPRPLLMLIIRVIRWMDFWGVNPKALTDGDPNYSSVLLSNLGSVQCPAVYHHLNNYGSNSFMLTMGIIREEEMKMPGGGTETRTVVDIGAILDERIGDGFYFARSLKLVKYLFAHPELMDLPLSEASGFDYR